MENRENRNFEPRFSESELFFGLANLLFVYGELHEPGWREPSGRLRTEEDGRSFVLNGTPPLYLAGIEEIEYVPESVLDGESPMNSLRVKFHDPELDRSAIFLQDVETGKVEAGMFIAPKTSRSRRASGLVSQHRERIDFMLTADDAPSPEDMLAIEDAYRRLEGWFA